MGGSIHGQRSGYSDNEGGGGGLQGSRTTLGQFLKISKDWEIFLLSHSKVI